MAHERHGYREVLKEFIKIYRSEPCIWQMKHKDYHNKVKKKAAYSRLIEQLKLIEPSADRDMVVRKINSLRTNFRKEYKKVEDSLRSGSQEVYVPNLWYFDLMKFLDGQDRRAPRSVDENESHETYEFEEMISDSIERESIDSDDREEHLEISPASPVTSRGPRSRKRKITCYPPDSTAWSSDVTHFTSPLMADDRFDIFGKNVAMKLRDIPKQQRLIAEKIINDTLFQAEMGILSLTKTE